MILDKKRDAGRALESIGRTSPLEALQNANAVDVFSIAIKGGKVKAVQNTRRGLRYASDNTRKHGIKNVNLSERGKIATIMRGTIKVFIGRCSLFKDFFQNGSVMYL